MFWCISLVMARPRGARAPPCPSSPSCLTVTPDPFNQFWGPSSTRAHPLAPVAPAARVVDRGRVFICGLCSGFSVELAVWERSMGPSRFLSPKTAFEFVMPRSCCRLPRACALLVAGGETWKQQKQNKKKTNEHRIRLKSLTAIL